jgi:hypothetical protein
MGQIVPLELLLSNIILEGINYIAEIFLIILLIVALFRCHVFLQHMLVMREQLRL